MGHGTGTFGARLEALHKAGEGVRESANAAAEAAHTAFLEHVAEQERTGAENQKGGHERHGA